LATNFIALVRGLGPVPPPFAQPTARAGNLYLPIPFRKSCKITQVDGAFYYLINYRAYPPGTEVESFRPEMLETHRALLEEAGRALVDPADFTGGTALTLAKQIPAKTSETLSLPAGPAAIRHLEFQLQAADLAQALRSTVVELEFDGGRTVWCPLGDFFSNVNGLDPYRTWEREARADGTLVCRWIMPYQTDGRLRLHNLAATPVTVNLRANVSPWQWTKASLHFHTCWRTDGPYPPRPVRDLNFVDVTGRGIHVGDTFIVLNPLWSWWGEGDEKVYVDEDLDRRFPSHFGTGTEDYYGWAGGEVPTRRDEFSSPFLANVRVGGQTRDWPAGKEPFTHGYNICTRTRSLDATPFARRFKFDMEAFNMIATQDAYLQYALVVHWYAAPGAAHNRPPLPEAAAAPVPQTEDVLKLPQQGMVPYATPVREIIEFENIKQVETSPGLKGGPQHIGETLPPYQWSQGALYFGRAMAAGNWVTFTLSGQSRPKRLVVHATQSYDYGILDSSVNEQPVAEGWDGYAPTTHPGKPLDLGVHAPQDDQSRLKFVVTGKNPKATGYFIGLDAVALEDTEETEISAEAREFLETDVFDARPRREWPQLVGLMKRPWGTAAMAILWNPGTSDQAATLDFAAVGLDPQREHAVWSYRDHRFLGFTRMGWTSPVLPAGQFFGNGVSSSAAKPRNAGGNYLQRVAANGDMTSFFVMPYQDNARINVINTGPQTLQVTMQIDSGDWTWNDNSMHFHANYRRETGIRTQGTPWPGAKADETGYSAPGAADYRFLTVRGKGVYVGDVLSVSNRTAGWWGEGDERIYVDYLHANGSGSTSKPQHLGTGTEDYYGYSFGSGKPFASPFVGQPSSIGERQGGPTVNSRVRGLDAIPFDRSFKFDLEIRKWAAGALDYDTIALWYGRPGAVALVPAADLAQDFKAGAQDGASAGTLADTAGDGKWSYHSSSHANPSAAGASTALPPPETPSHLTVQVRGRPASARLG